MTAEWRARAACSGRRDVDWFPAPSDVKGLAYCEAICRGCPVRVECKAFAEAEEIREGVWGGELRLGGRDLTRERLSKLEWRRRTG